MFNQEQAHREILERIASLERILSKLVEVDVPPPVEIIPRRDSVRRAEALARRKHNLTAQT